MNIKKLVLALSLVGVTLSTGSASAVTFYSPFTVFHDDNLDYVYDNDRSGTVSQGDRLVSVFAFGDSQGILAGQGPSNFVAPISLVGVADVTVISVRPDGTLVMGASSSTPLFGGVVGTTLAVYSNSTLNDQNIINSSCGTQAQCIAKAIDGTLFFTAGFFGDKDESWTSLPTGGLPSNISTVQNGNSTDVFASFNFMQSIGVNQTGQIFSENINCGVFCGIGGNGKVQLAGNGTINGGEGLIPTDWTARSKTDLKVAPAPIPEPATLGLLGLGLLGMMMTRRGRKQA